MSGMNEHPELQLSAYLDEALSPSERAAVAAHLDGCARCRAQLADLRATSRLVAALPQLAPGHSLVPRRERAPVWLRPARLLGAIGSGVFVFLFLASAVLNSGGGLGGGTTTAERLAAKGEFGAAANALASDAAARKLASQTPPVAAAAPAPAAAGQSPQRDASWSTAGSPSPAVALPQGTGAVATYTAASRTTFGPSPLVFLALAALFAVGAIVAHRRLRRT